ncbi:hypothetical protein NBRC116493_28260 [Aurantivibrio infirmus]
MNRQYFEKIAQSLASGSLQDEAWQLVPSSISARVAKSYDEKSGEFIYCKVFLPRNTLEIVKQYLRGSRARRAGDSASLLTQLGFETPKVIESGTRTAYSWLVTEGVNAVGLGDYVDKCLRGKLSPERIRWKRNIITALGTLVGRLHKKGIVHGDLRLNNILIDTQSITPRFYLVDNERNQYFSNKKVLPKELMIKNLVQVALLFPPYGSRLDQYRFIKAYRQQMNSLTAGQFNEMLQTVDNKIAERLKKLAKKPAWQNSLDLRVIENLPD